MGTRTELHRMIQQIAVQTNLNIVTLQSTEISQGKIKKQSMITGTDFF